MNTTAQTRRRFAWNTTAIFIFLLAPTLFMGCAHVGTGKITASLGLAHPYSDAAATYKKAKAKLDDLEKKSRLDPAAISSRSNSPFQESSRVRAGIAGNIGTEAATPTPALPNANASVLTSPTFSDIAAATKLADTLQASPFDLITNTRDIYESLIPAELRFTFDALRRDRYEFYHVPITISVKPGQRTSEGFIADIRFELPEVDNQANNDGSSTPAAQTQADAQTQAVAENQAAVKRNKRIAELTPEYANDPEFMAVSASWKRENISFGPTDNGTEPKKDYPEAFTILKELQDIRVFTISPLRQFDRRAETFARRIQREEALQLQLAGAASPAASAAANAGFDRIRRWESDFATITQNPLISGYLDNDNAFGWRIYPSVNIGKKGERLKRILKPGPRDLMVIIAVKRKLPPGVDLGTLGTYSKPSLDIQVKYTARWIAVDSWLPWSEELYPENIPGDDYFLYEINHRMKVGKPRVKRPVTGSMQIHIPGFIAPPTLSATLRNCVRSPH